MAWVAGGTMVLPPSSVVSNAASTVNLCRRPVPTTVRMPPYSSVPHSTWKSFVSLRKIVLSRKACSETLFVVGTSRSILNTSNCYRIFQ